MMKKVLSTCILMSMVSTSVFANTERNKSLDRMMYTINPNANLEGPVFRDQSNSATKNKYASDLVKLLLKEADKSGKRYLEADDSQAYYAILVMALTVPLQEGLYIQYRGVEGSDICRDDANNGNLVKKSGDANYKIFNEYFKKPGNEFFPDCNKIKTDKLTQIIRGGDGTDLSLMQVSIRWHFDDFLANKKFESVEKTINYGMGHLMKGFNPVYRNIKDYKCIADSGFMKKTKINYINLVRGIWAGQYNSGSIGKTCRFADKRSPYAHHDKGFEKNLNKILDFNGVLKVDLVGDFTLDKDVAAAVMEVTSNLKNGTNNRTALEKVLK